MSEKIKLTAVQDNIMRGIKIAKVTLNIGSGKDEEMHKKGLKLLQKLSEEIKPVSTVTTKRIPGWNLRPGLKIGCKATIRKNTIELLKRLLAAKNQVLSADNFDNQGNFSFGVPEYIDIKGLDYDPELKIMGLEVAVTLQRAGFRVKQRRIKRSRVGKTHLISRDEAMAFAKDKLQVEVR
ncbi:MAG TPA: 50S ribosomal protein L5 [Candidatus Nanoarchaeia archaeon]|nr:50S ribosomal protein L5 [Candidatus Nanoarchaeia archaeon]